VEQGHVGVHQLRSGESAPPKRGEARTRRPGPSQRQDQRSGSFDGRSRMRPRAASVWPRSLRRPRRRPIGALGMRPACLKGTAPRAWAEPGRA
jgi:hypothetical protein